MVGTEGVEAASASADEFAADGGAASASDAVSGLGTDDGCGTLQAGVLLNLPMTLVLTGPI